MVLQIIDTSLLPDWQLAALILGITVGVAIAVKILMRFWISHSSRFTNTDLDQIVYDEVSTPVYLSILVAGIFLVIPLISFPRLQFLLGASLLTLVVVLWARAAVRLGTRFLQHLRERNKEPEFAPVIKNLWTFMILVGGLFFLLSIWNIDITPFLAGAGVAGIIIGIAAQDSIGNFFAGISLNLDQTYQVGDMLLLEDDTRGTVTDISIRSTTILTRDNIEVTIPNNYLNNTMVINESSPRRRRRIRLDVGVAYGSNLEHVEEVLLTVANETRIIMDDPAPVVRFRTFSDSAIVAQLQCYINHPAQWGRARHALIKHISVAFADENIKIPFPQRELTFFEADNKIRLESDNSLEYLER